MREQTINLYQFNELSEEAQQKAIENLCDINLYDDWYVCTVEDAKEIGLLMGINIKEVYFSGFYSQGDGACFIGNYSYEKESVKKVMEYAPNDFELHIIAKELQKIQRKYLYSLSASVSHKGHYYHAHCTFIEVNDSEGNTNEEMESEVSECLRDFMCWIYRQLKKEYNSLITEEAIKETILENEYEFTKDGEFSKYVI